MSALWWLQPEWKQALCLRCGTNIWQSGGDPDWGYCYDCFTERLNEHQPEPDADAIRAALAALKGR